MLTKLRHFSFAFKETTECGLKTHEKMDFTHKDMREVTCLKCKKSKDYLEALRIWDAGYNSGYDAGYEAGSLQGYRAE